MSEMIAPELACKVRTHQQHLPASLCAFSKQVLL